MKPFRVGIVGYGWAATAHIPAINATSKGQVTAICSSRSLDGVQLSTTHGCPLKTYQNFADMLADPEIEVISICSYHRQHPEQIIAAAKAGKHIIAEKPLSLTLADLRAAEKAVLSAGVKLCICFELRYSQQFLDTKSILDNGLLGRVHYGEIDYYHGIGPWYREYSWCASNPECGSSLLAAGCHALDALLLCMGGEVEEVFTYGTSSSSPTFSDYEYPSCTATLLRFKDGRVGKCTSSIDCLQPYYFHTHLVGSEGSLLDNKYTSNKVEGLSRHQWSPLYFKPVDSGDVADHPYQTQFESFFTHLERGLDMPLTALADAVNTHEIIFASEMSLKQNRPVKLAEIRG